MPAAGGLQICATKAQMIGTGQLLPIPRDLSLRHENARGMYAETGHQLHFAFRPQAVLSVSKPGEDLACLGHAERRHGWLHSTAKGLPEKLTSNSRCIRLI